MSRLIFCSCTVSLLLYALCLVFSPCAAEEPHPNNGPGPTFCRPDLCPPATRHIGCVRSRAFSPACGKKNSIMPVNGGLRQRVLQQINVLRNFVASGLGNLSQAAHMPTMSWDRNLAHLAKILILQCDHESKYCSNTQKYNYVVTVEMTGVVRQKKPVKDTIVNKFLPSLFLDVMGCKMDAENRIVPAVEGSCVGHYVPLLQENGNRMGCATRIQQGVNNTKGITFLCQFSRANVNSLQPYEVGKKPGDKCNSGRSPMYKYLCNRYEDVDPNFVSTKSVGIYDPIVALGQQ